MRRLVVALVVAVLALSLAGCGGGEEPPATTAPTTQVPPPPPGTAVPTAEATDNRSFMATETFVPFTIAGDMPVAVQERLDTNQAMLLLFFNKEQESTDEVRSQVNEVLDDYRGNIDLIAYDLGKYTTTVDGVVSVEDEGLNADEKGKEAVGFARQVGVDHVPYIVIVDNQGYKIFWSRGFIDTELLGRQVYRATR